MDLTWLIPILPSIVAPFITGLFGYLAARNKAKKDIEKTQEETFVERQKLLAEEQQKFLEEQNQFRQEMREELRRVKDALLIEQRRNLALEDEIREWKQKYNALLIENQNLQLQITELKAKLAILTKNAQQVQTIESNSEQAQGD
jgi:chromosome segregation ATPase